MKKRKIIFFVLCFAFLGVLGIGAYHTVVKIKDEKLQEERRRIVQEYYEKKVAAFEEENKTFTDIDVAFIGDSLTDGCDLSLYYPDYKTANRGIGGDTTIGVEKRLKISLYDVQPKVVVMLIGGNNLDTMLENYEDIVFDIKENLPESELVLLSLTAMGKTLADKNEKAKQNNLEIQNIAAKYDCEYVDLFTLLYDTETSQIKESCTTDGAHLTDDGYRVVADAVNSVLEILLKKP